MKRLLALLTILIMSVGVLALVGCDNTPDNPSVGADDFIVKLVDASGNAIAGNKYGADIYVQACEFNEDGTGTCYTFSKADANGEVKFTAGKDDIPATSENLEFHVCITANCTPAIFLSYDQSKAHTKKGNSISITLTEKFATPTGTGAGAYKEGTTEIEPNGFDPYVLNGEDYDMTFGAVAYKVKFTSLTQKIYIAHKCTSGDGAEYTVDLIGTASAKITHLQGTLDTKLTTEGTDNSVQGANKSLSFEPTKDNEINYFELSAVAEADLGKEIIVFFHA